MHVIFRPSDRFLEALTQREQQVVDQVILGKTNQETGEVLGIAARTVEVFRLRAMRKLGAQNLAELVWLGLLGSLPPEKWDAEPLPNAELTGSAIQLRG